MSPPVFPVDGSLLATPPFPPSGRGEPASPLSSALCRRYDFPPAYPRPLIGFASAVRAIPPLSCPPGRSHRRGGRLQARAVVAPAARRSGSSRVDACGISQVFRRSIPCLCSAPGPRSNRHALAILGHLDAAPAGWTAKASAKSDFGANTQLRHLLPYASRGHCCTRARLASGRLAGLSPGGSRTHWTAVRGFSSC